MTRPIGFIEEWRPQAKTEALIAAVQTILDQYRVYGPMTVRQIFYRLVGTAAYPKTEPAYKSLAETLQRARRARIIPFSDIRDDGDTVIEAEGWTSRASLMEAIESTIGRFRLRADIGQPVRILLFAEAAGMAPMLARMSAPFGTTVRSAGGFDGVTSKHALAENIINHWNRFGRDTIAMHVGDHDPSGAHIFLNLERDVSAFIGDMGEDEGIVTFERIAVTPEQIVALGLPTAPAKATDRRSFNGVGDDPTATVQAEAIDPATLSGIVEAAILGHWDEDAAKAVIAQEAEDSALLKRWWEERP